MKHNLFKNNFRGIVYTILGIPLIIINGIYKEFGSPSIKTIIIFLTCVAVLICTAYYVVSYM